MRVRRQTTEHPFGTLKSWMGYTHFQMKTLKHVSTKMSLHVLAQVTDDGTQPQRAHESNRQYADNEQNDHRLQRIDVFHRKFSF
jgi:hypothetical protein